ncbi:hypothetical protein ACT6QG_10955 [Xanthobacter sp. TB0136]|uniref:hypothetical protein n=1 Tax=Xanthobacter sp. TB0136 TaxID=3459177 RepID=UPI00403A37AF
MIAIGCLAPLILGVMGALGGHWLAGNTGLLWGGVGGLVLGGLVLGFSGWVVFQMKKDV